MEYIDNCISESLSNKEAKSYLFKCLDKTDDYSFDITPDTCPKLSEYYSISDIYLGRAFREHPEYIHLVFLFIDKYSRESGNGTRFMEDLCEWADSRGKTIILTPDPEFGASSRGRLVRFYKRFGFVENQGKNTDFTHRQFMHRKPNVTEAVASRKVGKYIPKRLTLGSTINEFERFVKDAGIEMVANKTEEYSDIKFGSGSCYVYDLLGNRKGFVEYTICPSKEDFRIVITFSNGRVTGGFIEYDKNGMPETDMSVKTTDALDKIYDYYR